MKKFILPIVLAGLFAACTEDEVYDNFVPVQEGDEIQFGSTLTTGEGTTRTEYGDLVINGDGSKYFPVYWKTGDQIIICCPQANYPYVPNAKGYEKTALYTITANEKENKHIAASVDKATNKGLQWGAPGLHQFYSIYPASAVGTVNDKGFYAVVEPYQQAVSVDLLDNVYTVQPNMDHALMIGYSAYNTIDQPAQSSIDLKFRPLMTVLEVTILGPQDNTNPINISKITVSSVDGTPISGTYLLHVNPTDGSISEAISSDPEKATSSITVSTLNEKGVELKPGQKAVYKVFLAPNVDENVKLKVAVGTQFGTLTKTLNKTTIQKQKVNRVTLPEINRHSANNYWMSDLDKNIYITELSYPGSKLSFVKGRYQQHGVKEQFDDGVRAFIVQCTPDANGGLVVSTESNPVLDDGKKVPIEQAVDSIKIHLASIKDKAPQEFAVIMFTYLGSEYNDSKILGGQYDNGQTWTRRLRKFITDYVSRNPGVVYENKIDPNTTIADVANKIIFKANFNNDEMNTGWWGSTDNVPLLLSHWMNKYPHEDAPQYADGIPLYWGHADANRRTNDLYWFYQEVTNVTDNETSHTAVPLKDKIALMNKVFDKSIELYQKDNLHRTWYMNDIGGTYNGTKDTIVNNQVFKGDSYLIHRLNGEAAKKLRARKVNAGLGLVFMNNADRFEKSGALFGSDWLIQTIIDNNFKFGLRKKASSTPAQAPTRVVEGTSEDEWDK